MSNYADALKRNPAPPQTSHPSDALKEEDARKTAADTSQSAQFPKQRRRATFEEQSSSSVARRRVVSSGPRKPVVIAKRPSGTSHVQHQQSNKKPKKPKPTLQHMNLGDVMPRTSATAGKIASKTPPATKVATSLKTASEEEFPSLGAGAIPVSKMKPSLPAHASWGKRPAKPDASIKSSKQPAAAVPSKTNAESIAGAGKKSNASNVTADWPQAKPRTDGGEEHDLIRLMHDGKFQSKTKGRTRLTPRKKKFTTLKKKVLQERLEAWQKQNAELEQSIDDKPAASTCTVLLDNFAEADQVEDEEEYEEIVDNLKDMATKVEPIRDAFVFRQPSGSCPAFVRFHTAQSAKAACACWTDLVLSGQRLQPQLFCQPLEVRDDTITNEAWRKAVLSVYSSEKKNVVNEGSKMTGPMRVVLTNILTQDDFEDEECLEESLADIRKLAEQHGTVSAVDANRNETGGFVTVTYVDGAAEATNAVAQLNGAVMGGITVSARFLDETTDSNRSFVVQLMNALTEDDYDDEQCLQESLADIESMARQYGSVSSVKASKVQGGVVLLTYTGDQSIANNVVEKLDGAVLGGNILAASVLSSDDNDRAGSGEWRVVLRNMLTDDDLADEDCLRESIGDVKELGGKYGTVIQVDFDSKDRVVTIEYEGGECVANSAAKHFNGMIIGNKTVAAVATCSNREGSDVQNIVRSNQAPVAGETASPIGQSQRQEPPPLFSGDKLISERFAECKRASKLATAPGPRSYASLSGDDDTKRLLIEMLGELMRLQRRAIEDKNAKARRRIVMGLREVARGIRAHKVKMVVMANNVDQYGAIDEKLQEILDLAQEEDVPVIFELNKRHLGKAVGKSIKVSVVGIQNVDGAYQQFKKLASIAHNNLK